MATRLPLAMSCLATTVALLGCAAEPALELVPVRGRVSLGGKGVSHVAVQLVADEKKGTTAPTGLGQSDADGQFKISTPPHGEGAVPGHYKVTVTSYSGTVPKRYSDPVGTPLSIEVPEAGLQDWKLDLTSP